MRRQTQLYGSQRPHGVLNYQWIVVLQVELHRVGQIGALREEYQILHGEDALEDLLRGLVQLPQALLVAVADDDLLLTEVAGTGDDQFVVHVLDFHELGEVVDVSADFLEVVRREGDDGVKHGGGDVHVVVLQIEQVQLSDALRVLFGVLDRLSYVYV